MSRGQSVDHGAVGLQEQDRQPLLLVLETDAVVDRGELAAPAEVGSRVAEAVADEQHVAV